jgi:hypothetical protein
LPICSDARPGGGLFSTSVAGFEKCGGLILFCALFQRHDRDRRTEIPRRRAGNREQAEKAISQLDKEAWLRLAADWIKLAQAAEERHRF